MHAISLEVIRQIEWFSPQGASYETETGTNGDVCDLRSPFWLAKIQVWLGRTFVSGGFFSRFAWKAAMHRAKVNFFFHLWEPDVLTQLSQVWQMWFGASLPLSIATCALAMKSKHPPSTHETLNATDDSWQFCKTNLPSTSWLIMKYHSRPARKALTCISEEVIRRPTEHLAPSDISTLHGGSNGKMRRLKIS